MKFRLLAAVAVTSVSAQAQYDAPSTSSRPASSPVSPVSKSSLTSYVTVTYDDCPSQSIESLITVTEGTTVTYCPECHHDMTSSKPAGPSHTTVYTTVYQSLCSTGLVPVTYTVTEECEEPTPTWTKSDHVPQGFTVTVKECHVCDKTPVPVTITEPCHDGCGKPKPKPTTAPTGPSGGKPAEQIPDGQVQAPGPSGSSGGKPAEQIPDGQVQAPGPSGGSGGSPPSPSGGASNPGGSGGTGSNSPAPGGSGSGSNRPAEQYGDEKCPGPQCSKPSGDKPSGDSPAGEQPAPGGSASNGATPPYPTGSSGDSDKCPGPQCKPQGTDSASTPANSGDTSNIEPYVPGSAGATVTSLGFISSICMAAVVAVLAFAL